MKNEKFLWALNVLNEDKKWWQFWKSGYVTEYYYIVVKDGFLVLGNKKEEK